MKGLGTEASSSSCVPAQLKTEMVGCYSVRESLDGEQHHHPREDTRRVRRAFMWGIGLTVSKIIITAHRMTMTSHELVSRSVFKTVTG